jgi:interferon-induced transmembrane protein
MSGPTNPPPEDDWGAGGDEWREPPQAPQQPPQQPPPTQPGYQPAPPPPPPNTGSQGYPGQGQGQGYPGQGQGYPGQGQGQPSQNIPNYLVHSIVATLLCCLPAGVVGIVFASQVNTKLAMGDIAGAKKASDNARLWTIISVGAGIVFYLFVIVATSSG